MISKGDEIRDADGVLYATITRDINVGDVVTMDCFAFAGDAPRAGDLHPQCVWDFFTAKAKDRDVRRGVA
jgi:hypothetical protein